MMSIILVTVLAAPASAWWIICWKRQVAGVSDDGVKVYCRKCWSKQTDTRPMPRDNCKDFVGRSEAQDWFNKHCDCP